MVDGQITIWIEVLPVNGHDIPHSLTAFLIVNTIEILITGIGYLFNIFTDLDFRYHGLSVHDGAHFIYTAEYRCGFAADQILANPHAVDLCPL